MRTSFAAALLASVAPLFAQGTGSYFNVESPQCKPIAIATVAGHDYLLACNTPDNTVEIYDTIGNAWLHSVRVGAEPVSVVWNAALSRFYAVDFLGDSVTVVALSAPSSSGPLGAKGERSVWVGDEPMHVSVASDGKLFVTLGSQSAIGWLDPITLLPLGPGTQRIDLVDSFAVPTKALKDPRTTLARGNKVHVLGTRGGKAGFAYDFDLWSVDLGSGAITALGGLGTINFNMAFAENGDLYVVGLDSQFQLLGETKVRNAATGFAKTMLYRVTGAGTPGATVVARDLNTQTTSNGSIGSPVAFAESLAHPTDVVVYEPPVGPRKLYLAAFNSDRIGVVQPAGVPTSWTIGRIDVKPLSNAMAGPRGLVVKTAKPSLTNDPGARVYVLNRLDNSVGVIDPVTDQLLNTFALQRDPTPDHVRAGRPFLYSAKLSGNGFGSCASCHIDARSDFLAWNLSDNSNQPLPPELLDGVVNGSISPFWPNAFPPNKDFLVTQTLQGMVNHEVNAEAQPLFSNEPLHWRADRKTFADFNGAFVNLLGRATQLTPQEMTVFTRFVFAVAYPPNPEQPGDRVYSGAFGTAGSTTDGSGAQRGLKLFHMRAISKSAGGGLCAGRSCVQCHALPEGSNNRIVLFSPNTFVPSNPQPMESSALRLLRQKERRLQKDGSATFSPVATGLFGLEHEGISNSINEFIDTFFAPDFQQSSNELPDLFQLVRELDTGAGPLIGIPLTVNMTNANDAAIAKAMDLGEVQARSANSGIAAKGRINGNQRGFWFDVGVTPPVYREEPSGAVFDRRALLALLRVSDDVLVFEATALGSERRTCWPGTGTPAALPGGAPRNVTLEPLAPATPWQNVPLLTKNWTPGTGPDDFNWLSTVPQPRFLQTIRIYQYGLIQDGAGLGLTQLRHEAPRRFQVAGDDIRHGARLALFLPIDPLHPPPSSQSFIPLIVPLHATDRVNAQGKKVWQTAVEIEPLIAYLLMLGGIAAPNVGAVLQGTFTQEPPPPGTFDPTTWNSCAVFVVNEPLQVAFAGWQRLRIQ